MGRIAATELMPDFGGRTLSNGRFQLLESLGAGAYGKVYRAMDTSGPLSMPKFYAIKCLNKPEPGSHTDILQQREFALHSLVSGHPNIVTFHQYFSDERYVYVVLDLCSGGDLFAAITEKHIFHNNGRLIRTAFIQLIDAVQHCHDLGVFHRDIKPENVLCSKDGTDIRLADFGLSIKSPICHDFGCGSSYYMSPECIGREITTGNYSTRHNDVWALGVILTNMITGRNPWRYATSDDDCFSAYLHDNNFLRQVLPISEGVNTILKRVFTINPLRRISLPTLRRAILELDTFFTDGRDITVGKGTVADDTKVEKVPENADEQKDEIDSKSTLFFSGDPLKNFGNSDEYYVFASPVVDHHTPVAAHPQLRFSDVALSSNPTDFIIGESESANSLCIPSSVPSSASSGSSGPESKGPITPATYAVESAISVPDIPEEEGLGQPAELASATLVSKFKAPNFSAKSKKPKAHLFRTAVQRIKGLSAANSS